MITIKDHDLEVGDFFAIGENVFCVKRKGYPMISWSGKSYPGRKIVLIEIECVSSPKDEKRIGTMVPIRPCGDHFELIEI